MSTQVKNQMREIFIQAWQFVRRNGFTLSEALKCAWLNYKLKVEMYKRIVKFYFVKVDGSTREAYGSLRADIVPETQDSDRRRNDTVQVFFDCEKQSWRCYKKANLLRLA